MACSGVSRNLRKEKIIQDLGSQEKFCEKVNTLRSRRLEIWRKGAWESSSRRTHTLCKSVQAMPRRVCKSSESPCLPAASGSLWTEQKQGSIHYASHRPAGYKTQWIWSALYHWQSFWETVSPLVSIRWSSNLSETVVYLSFSRKLSYLGPIKVGWALLSSFTSENNKAKKGFIRIGSYYILYCIFLFSLTVSSHILIWLDILLHHHFE